MNIQKREEQNNFIENLPYGLWSYLVLLCGTTLDFYSLVRPKHNTDNDVSFFLDLLKNEEKNIDEFRSKFKAYIENNGGNMKKLSPFPKYFHQRDKKVINPKAEKIRIKLITEQDMHKRAELINELKKIQETDNPQYRALTKSEEAEHCLYWALHSCRLEFKNDKLKDFLGLPKANFLYGYACGLLGIDVFGMYYKLNEYKSPHVKGGETLEKRSQIAKAKLIELWEGRFSNPLFSAKVKKTKSQFANYLIENPSLIIDKDGKMLTKGNGEAYYSEKKSITDFLSAYEKTKI